MNKRKRIIVITILIFVGLIIIFYIGAAIITPGTFIGTFIFHLEQYQKQEIIKDFYSNKIDFENILNYIDRYNAQFDSPNGYSSIGLYKNVLIYRIMGAKENEIKMNFKEKMSLLKLFNSLHYYEVLDSPRYQNEHNTISHVYNTVKFQMDDNIADDDIHGIMYIYDGNKPVESEGYIYSYEHLEGNWYYWEGGWDPNKSIWEHKDMRTAS